MAIRPDRVRCSCCGEERDASTTAALQNRPDIVLCRDCIAWLGSRAGVPDSTPTLPVLDLPEAVRFYEAAGFEVRPYDDSFAYVTYQGTSVFDIGVVPRLDPATNGAACYISTPDADAWHARLVAAGIPVSVIEDTPWGMHEFALADRAGNGIRIGRPMG